MKPPLFVRTLTATERQQLQAGLRSAEAFTLRRCQILLASDQGHAPKQIVQNLGCPASTVRHVIHAFGNEGLACLRPKSSRPKTVKPVLDSSQAEPIKALLHQSPRTLGKDTSLWTLSLLATVCCERGLTPEPLSVEGIRQALKRFGISWKRAKHWITSPDPEYARKKRPATG